MTEEKTRLIASTQYGDAKGEVSIDDHVKNETVIHQCPEGFAIIGWHIGKYDYNSKTHVKILTTEVENIRNGVIDPNAKLYWTELDITVDEFIKNLGRIEITALKRGYQDNYGKEFTFVHDFD